MLIAAIISAVLVAAATAASVIATENAASYNKEVAQQEADAAQARAAREAERRRRLSRRRESKIRTSFAAAGVDISSGSAFDVAVDQAIQGEMDAYAALDEGNLLSWQRETEKKRISFTSRAQQTTTILSGAGAVAGSFSRVVGDSK